MPLLFFVHLSIAQSLADNTSISSLKFINEYVIPFNQNYKGTSIGGLSGIDFDQEHNLYYILSDDRSDINPVRFYTIKINLSSKGIDTVSFESVHFLLQANGEKYLSFKQHPDKSVDPEDLRLNLKSGQFFWSSEGERIVKDEDVILIKPFVQIADLEGKFVDKIPLPSILNMQSYEKGPRRNGTIEGISFNKNFDTLYAALEEPMYEDGPRADVTKTNSWIRVFQFDMLSKKNTAQYAYLLEPIAYPANPIGEFKVNGVTEILSLSKTKLLTVERSYSSGRLPCTIKVFIADFTHADDIKKVRSLKEQPPLHAFEKRLLLNMDDLGIYIDNIEGVTFGPTLPNGHATLIFVADDNFKQIQKTQLLLFEVIP
jgi:hypothetical protein